MAIDAGMNHYAAVLDNHTVRAWGGLTLMPGEWSNVVAVAAGRFNALALRSDGSITGWGNNGNGQIAIPADLKPAIAVGAGPGNSLAVLEDGTVADWGGPTGPPGLSNVVAISCGSGFNVALTSDGRVTAWGQNESGQTNVPAGLNGVMAISAGEGHSRRQFLQRDRAGGWLGRRLGQQLRECERCPARRHQHCSSCRG